MSAIHPVNDPSWTPPSLIQTFTGHLFTGILKLLVVALLFWLSILFSDSMSASLATSIGVLVATLILGELLAVSIERPFVIRGRLNEPGGWGYSVLQLFTYLLTGTMFAFIAWVNSATAIVFVIIHAAVNLGLFFLIRPWQAGETQQETDAKIAEFKATTKEHFAEDIVEIKARARERTKNAYYATEGKKRRQSKSEDQD
ncbi:MAG TPA: hypothetical protein DCY59_12970 [Micrococcaceae bacterium]|nr:hypothetical protein [Micrococcaceae bacterium]